MHTVTVTGWLEADPVTEHIGDLVVCELRLAVERPGSDQRTGELSHATVAASPTTSPCRVQPCLM